LGFQQIVNFEDIKHPY